ncbi:MAG TPA: adenylate/guanylate cyclase domain-containing protein [Candidatus Cloacimonadota bacterium]|nr:adenylate/guanylate cyclase domain-containing protein [Candidatus Cloacimonadota bacterium]
MIINYIIKRFKKWYVLLFFAFIIAVLSYSLQYFEFFKLVEIKTLDLRFKRFPLEAQADSSIVLVAIDNSSLIYAKDNGVMWPWSRDFYAYITNFMAYEGAKAVLYDIQFYEPDYDRLNISSEESDNSFAYALQNYNNVILGVQYGQDSLHVPADINRFAIPVLDRNKSYAARVNGARFPIEQFRNSVSMLGGINIQPDDDGVIRRVPLFYQLHDLFVPQISFIAAYRTKNMGALVFNNHILQIDSQDIQLDNNDNYQINWYGKGGSEGVFKYIPFKSVIQSAAALEYGEEPSIEPGFFKDKYIIIGATADGLMDLKTSPYTKIMPGMEIWATILSNLLNNHYIYYLPNLILFIYIFFISFIILYSFVKLKATFSNLIVLTLLTFSIVGISFLWKYRIYLNLIVPIIAIIISYLTIVFISYIMEGKSKKEIRRVFTRYLHPDIIATLIDNPDQVEMGGEEIEATVMFSDIYNFTTFSEGKHPKDLVKDLNEYFTAITNIILDNNGLLDKYTGDGLMAIFGAPIPRKDHAYLACKSAILHKKFAEALSKETNSASSLFHQNTRLGINSGTFVAGNIGSEKRMDYTAIGDAVNLSARLEGVNKIYKTKIIISESSYLFVKDDFVCRELDYLRVKGKTEPTRIYELIDFMDKKENYQWIDTYRRALSLYRQGEFQNAKEIFDTLTMPEAYDEASATMSKRCSFLLENPPHDWDGILTLLEK